MPAHQFKFIEVLPDFRFDAEMVVEAGDKDKIALVSEEWRKAATEFLGKRCGETENKDGQVKKYRMCGCVNICVCPYTC